MPQRLPLGTLTIVAVLSVFLIGTSLVSGMGRGPVVSRWGSGPGGVAVVPAGGPLIGQAELVAQPVAPPPPAAQAAPVAPPAGGAEQLAAFNAGSTPVDSAGDGAVAYFRRAVGGGELMYAVAQLEPRVHVRLINADDARPTSDATGDTMWADGGRHLQPVIAMATAPYAARPGEELLWAMAFGFHGDARTSNEGSVVIDGAVLRVNAGRGALCITADGRASIGKLGPEELARCDQAVGGGPVILWQGKIANPDVGAADGEFIPFNPLGEDFVQLDWRILVYRGDYPKTAVCVGDRADGRAFLVLVNSAGVGGVDMARAMRDMGCHTALGGDDDTSTQAVWRGQQLWSRPQRPVPDAIAVYLKH
jgi:hypothetical protein